MKNLCLDCPDDVRGLCCCMNVKIGKHNIMLENVVCPYLDRETKLCTEYENRREIASYCLDDSEMFGTGGLPEGCLYLVGHPEREPHPKVHITSLHYSVIGKLVGVYNLLNNTPFENFVPHLIKIGEEAKT